MPPGSPNQRSFRGRFRRDRGEANTQGKGRNSKVKGEGGQQKRRHKGGKRVRSLIAMGGRGVIIIPAERTGPLRTDG